MTTIERIWGPEALEELATIKLTPQEQAIHDLFLEGYGSYFFPVKVQQYDPLPAVYRNIKIP